MRLILIAPVVALAACSGTQNPGNAANSFDVANAASSAQNDIDAYAGSAPADSGPASGGGDVATGDGDVASAPADLPPASPPMTGIPPSLPETPVTNDNAQGAANVVQTYYALLESGRYRQAWRLWDNGGRASGMSADAFAASFAKYREYHANIGAPGRIDAGAGQRHVTVPVKVYGTLKAGNRPFAMAGPVTLHRTADIDGATAEQKLWRISNSGVRPRPAPEPSPSPAATVSARYRCADGTDLVVRFDNAADTATLRLGNIRVVIPQQRAASGIWYRGKGYELRGKGRNADFRRPGNPATACVARG